MTSTLHTVGELAATGWDFVSERWVTTGEPDPMWTALISGLALLVAAVPSLWRVARQAGTIIHEMGHVVVAVLTGRTVRGIALHSDTSGVTVSRGRPTGPGMLLTTLAGYPAPGILAAGLAWLVTAGHAGAALTVYQVVLVAALLLSRNAVGIASCLAAVLAIGAVWWWNDPAAVMYLVVALSVFYAVAGVRSSVDVIQAHARARRSGGRETHSDAAQAARAWRALPLPAPLWLLGFLLMSLASAAAVAWFLFG